MKRTILSRLLPLGCCLAVVGPFFLAGAARAEPAWHKHALQVHVGYVENFANVDSRPGYKPLAMGNDMQFGVGYDMVMDDWVDLHWDVYHSEKGKSQRSVRGYGHDDDRIAINLEIFGLSSMVRLRHNRPGRRIVPWVGVGLHLGLLERKEQERLVTAGQLVLKPRLSDRSGSIGAEVAAGLDVYPTRQSAFALSFAGRYRKAFINGHFDGDIDGIAAIFALKWDFGLSTR